MLRPSLCVLLTGATGQLGQALSRLLGPRAIAVSRAELDLSQPEQIASVIKRRQPDVVINCAAYTQVDQAEREAAACFAVNATAVAELADACERIGSRLVQISTDYVFGGTPALGRPWRESDPPAPQSFYAQSKLAGEVAAQRCSRHLIVRTCGLYGGGPLHVSFVEKMLQLAQQRKHLRIVSDQHCTPTLVDDVAEAIGFLATTEQLGVYHIVNSGHTTWYAFATEIFRLAGLTIELEPITTTQFGAPALRPLYSVLDTQRYHSLGGPAMRSWQLALAAYLQRRCG